MIHYSTGSLHYVGTFFMWISFGVIISFLVLESYHFITTKTKVNYFAVAAVYFFVKYAFEHIQNQTVNRERKNIMASLVFHESIHVLSMLLQSTHKSKYSPYDLNTHHIHL